MTTSAIERARRFSEPRLRALAELMPGIVPAEVVVVACGSYARREACAASDFDYFAIAPRLDGGAPWAGALRQAVGTVVKVAPAGDGAFGKVETRDGMVRNIGGQEDDNQKLTRRMLFLLEGVPLHAAGEFRAVRRAILERYLRRAASEPLALFLLNDIIRYYRTMAVDYEYKTTEGERPKPWGLRSVKLMFSRRLLYASGLFSVGCSLQTSPGQKADGLERLLDMPVTDRVAAVCGAQRAAPVLHAYDRFLAMLEDGDTRARLDAFEDHADPLFADIRAEGWRFAATLLALFHDTFEPGHPIHQALVI